MPIRLKRLKLCYRGILKNNLCRIRQVRRKLIAYIRSSLIVKGMIWSPTHGDTAFTVPLFDEFMKRIVPDKDW